MKRRFEQVLRVDRLLISLCCATPCSLPATQGQRSKDQSIILERANERVKRTLSVRQVLEVPLGELQIREH
jgi:hypothetical protein